MSLVTFTERALVVLLVSLLALELVTLVGRLLFGPHVKTISMILRDNRNRLTGVVFALSAMPAHWWFPTMSTYAWGTVAFWLLALGLFAWDVALWRKPPASWPGWVRVVRDSRAWVVLGFVAGLALFPQAV